MSSLVSYHDTSGNQVIVTETSRLPVDATGELTASGTPYSSSASKTRPNDTTAYAALDVIAEDASAGTVWTFANIGPAAGGKILLTRVSLRIDVNAIPAGMGAFRLHLYNAAPTAINDNAAYNLPSGDRAKYLGYVEIPSPLDLGDTLYADTEAMGFPIRMQLTLPAEASGSLFGILQTVAGFTPTAQAVYNLALEAELV